MSNQDCTVKSEDNCGDSAVQSEIEGEAVIVEDSVGKGIHESEKCSITASASASSAMATTDRTTSSTAKQVQVVQWRISYTFMLFMRARSALLLHTSDLLEVMYNYH